MRVLRQAPALYRNPGYLLANAGLLILLGVFGFLVSCPTVLGAAQTAGGVVYFGLVVPVLTVPLSLIAWAAEHLLLPAITALLYWIAARSGNQDPAVLESVPGRIPGGGDFTPAEEPLFNGVLALKVVGVALLGIGCILLFRRLLQKNKVPLAEADQAKTRRSSRRMYRRWPSFFLSPNARVRRAYGRYLERQARHGATWETSETSLDLLGRTPFLDPEAEQQLRLLYLKARYGECATPQDAAAAERLERALEQPEQSER